MKLFLKALVILTVLLPAYSTVLSFPVPDTGQTKCYNNTVEIPCPQPGEAFYGQDAQYQGLSRSYTKLGLNGVPLADSATQADGWTMTRDNVTGLIWEIKTNDGSVHDKDNSYTWYDGNPETNGGNAGVPGSGTDTDDFLSALNTVSFGGFSDWRLPTVNELSSLVNANYKSTTIDTVWFPSTVPDGYWSSTTYAHNSSDAFRVGFDYGGVGYKDKSNSYYVRAVRYENPVNMGHLVDNRNGTVTDSRSGLMWQKSTSSIAYTWQQALGYAEELTLAEYSDWRLPDRNELQTLVNYSRSYPAIDPLMIADIVSSYYWSSTTYADGAIGSWLLSFSSGSVYYDYKSTSYAVRAARTGQYGPLLISSPGRGSMWTANTAMPILWDTGALAGQVDISISKDGGKTFTSIASTSNDGNYDWTVAGEASVNCVLKIVPLAQPSMESAQGMFSIMSPLPGDVNNSGAVDITDAVLSIQIASGITTTHQIYKSANINGDGSLGTEEAIYALQASAGVRFTNFSDSVFSGAWIASLTTHGNMYLLGDGSGGISEYSGIIHSGDAIVPPPGGSYSVQPDGSFSMALNTENWGTTAVNGNFSTPTNATVVNPETGILVKVSDLGAAQGTWVGTLAETDTGTVRQIGFSVDQNGSLSSFTGLSGPVTGKMFSEAGNLAAFFKTAETGYYNQVTLNATLSGDSITGTFSYDGPGDNGNGTVNLTRYNGTGYTASDFVGIWIIDVAGGPGKIFVKSDGNGNISSYSGVIQTGYGSTPPGGSYSVIPDGSITLSLNAETGSPDHIVNGKLSSETEGIVTTSGGGDMRKVSDVGTCTGNWIGTLTESVSGAAHPISFTVDTDGVVTRFSGMNAPVSGEMYSTEGKLAAFFKTNEGNSYNQITFSATLSGDSITGTFSYDGEGDNGNGTVSLTRYTNDLYTNADFYGPWIMDLPSGPGKIYFIGNGNGVLTESSRIIQDGHGTTPPGGTYSIQNNGGFSMSLDTEDGGSIPVTGALSSHSAGAITSPLSGTVQKVSDVSACQGTWSGWLYPNVENSFQISFTVDAYGQVTSFSGLNGPISGHLFCESGKVAAFIKTGETGGPFNQLTFNASLSGSNIAGTFSYDGPDDPNGTITVSR